MNFIYPTVLISLSGTINCLRILNFPRLDYIVISELLNRSSRKAGLAAITDIGIDNAEAFAEFFGKPGLLDALLLKHFFYSIHGFIHRVQCSFYSAKI